MMKIEKFLSKKLKYENKSIGVHVDTVRMPSGKIEERIWVDFPSVCVIAPFINKREVLLVQQYRHAIKEITYEFPAGKFVSEEPVETAALRELKEETSYTGNVRSVYNFRPSPHYSNEILWICIATDLKPVNFSIDSDEIQEVKKITLSEIFQMIEEGKIIDGKTITALLYLYHTNVVDTSSLLV
ncbi:MAG: NUDIX hydrolase [Candidatus Hodarchaeales archaeon]|jgi:ADP-ribose pyrophosphatase